MKNEAQSSPLSSQEAISSNLSRFETTSRLFVHYSRKI